METTNTLHWAASPVKYVGVNGDDTGHNSFHQEPVIPFALKYKPAENPPHLTENQRTDILRRVNLPQLGPDEASLALSRIEFYGDYNQLSRKIEAIVSDCRAEKIAVPKLRPEAEWRIARKHSDDLAKRELLASTSALAHLDAKLAAAKAAQAEADAIEAELNKNWLEWSAIPAKAQKLVARLANGESERSRLNGADYDAAIKERYLHAIDPEPGVSMSGSLTELLGEKQLPNVKLSILSQTDIRAKRASVKG